jgi:hypothetical protein
MNFDNLSKGSVQPKQEKKEPEFKPATNFSEKALSEMMGIYLRNMIGTGMIAVALPNIVWLIQKILHIGFNFFFLMAILLLWVVGLLGICRIILAIIVCGKIRLGEFVWRQGRITGYKTAKRNGPRSMLYIMVDDQYYCSFYGSPIYKKGTDVYYIRMKDAPLTQDMVISF